MPIDLSIIIVNYKSSLLIIDCIKSIKEQTSLISYEIIIVDNFSGDKSRDLICNNYPEIKWLQMNYNSGFARANNAGIKIAMASVVLLLNPDTLLLRGAVEKCYSRFVKSTYIACGVQLLNPDCTPQISGSFFMKGGLNHLLPLPYLGGLFRRIAFSMKVKTTNVKQADIEEKVDWINGAFLMVKKSAVEKAGLLDEDFFLYFEEIEWCSRLEKAGDLCVYGDLKVIHLEGATINQQTRALNKGYNTLFDKKGLQLMVSSHLRIRKQFGVTWFIFHLSMFTLDIPIYAFCSFWDHLFHGANPFSDREKIIGFAKNVYKLWLLLPAIIKGKPHFYKMF